MRLFFIQTFPRRGLLQSNQTYLTLDMP
ncbi:hypothetical protein SOVF_152510, partial [Spinacia oleracea]